MSTFAIQKLDLAKLLFPGFLISGLIALAAQFISEHHGVPAMLMALLFGIAPYYTTLPILAGMRSQGETAAIGSALRSLRI